MRRSSRFSAAWIAGTSPAMTMGVSFLTRIGVQFSQDFMIACMIFSWLASFAGISPTMRPSFIT